MDAHDMIRKTFYLAGPMTGLPNFNYDGFERAKQQLEDHMLEIVSPHSKFKDEDEFIRKERSHAFYMAHAINLLMTCNAIILMPGWSKSRGARTEFELALSCGYSVYYYLPDQKPPLMELV
jgi:hypothetical protein